MSEKLDQYRKLREARASRGSAGGSRVGTLSQENPRPHAERLQQEPATPDTASTAKRKPRAAKRRDVGNVAKPEVIPTAHRDRRRPSEPKPKRKAKAKKQKPTKAPKVKIGRPRVEDRGKTLSDLKPWLTAKPPMSRATYYRRKLTKA